MFRNTESPKQRKRRRRRGKEKNKKKTKTIDGGRRNSNKKHQISNENTKIFNLRIERTTLYILISTYNNKYMLASYSYFFYSFLKTETWDVFVVQSCPFIHHIQLYSVTEITAETLNLVLFFLSNIRMEKLEMGRSEM